MRGNSTGRVLSRESTHMPKGPKNNQCVCSILREKKRGSEKTLDHLGPCRRRPGVQVSSYRPGEATGGMSARVTWSPLLRVQHRACHTEAGRYKVMGHLNIDSNSISNAMEAARCTEETVRLQPLPERTNNPAQSRLAFMPLPTRDRAAESHRQSDFGDR